MIDAIVVAAVVVAVVLVVRARVRAGAKGGCSGCGSASVCAGSGTGPRRRGVGEAGGEGALLLPLGGAAGAHGRLRRS